MPSAVRCGMLQRLVRSWLSPSSAERLERAVAERDHSHDRDAEQRAAGRAGQERATGGARRSA